MAHGADGQRRGADGPDIVNPWPREVRTRPAATSWTPASRRFRRRPTARWSITRRSGRAARAAARRSVVLPERVVHEPPRARAVRCRQGRHDPAAGSGSPLNALEQQGKAVFVRACTQCHGGPAQSNAPVIAGGGSIPRHASAVPASRRYGHACAIRLRAVPGALARNARTYEITWRSDAANGVTGTKVRRTSSDPGRALLTGFVGGRPRRTTGTSSTCPACAGSAGRRPTSTTTAPPRSKRWWTTTSSSSSASRPTCRRRRAPGGDDRRRELRSAAASRRTRGAARLPAEVVGQWACRLLRRQLDQDDIGILL